MDQQSQLVKSLGTCPTRRGSKPSARGVEGSQDHKQMLSLDELMSDLFIINVNNKSIICT